MLENSYSSFFGRRDEAEPAPLVQVSKTWIQNLFIAIVYVAAYTALDQISFVYNSFERLNITPWNPPVATSLVLLLLFDFRWAPMLFVAPLISDWIVRDFSETITGTFITDFAEAVVYTFAAWLIRYRFKINPDLRSTWDIAGLMLGGAIGAALVALAYVGTFAVMGMIPREDFAYLVFKYWVGDAIGIMTTAPFILVYRHIVKQTKNIRHLLTWETLGQACAVLLVMMVFFFQIFSNDQPLYYIMFLPVIWIAVRHGLPGVTLTLLVIQGLAIPLMFATHFKGADATRLQFFLILFSITNLLLGMVVSEREKARDGAAQSQAKLRALIDMAPDGLLVVDANEKIEDSNQLFQSMSGLTQGEVVGRPMDEFLEPYHARSPNLQLLRHRDGTKLLIEVSTSRTNLGDAPTSIISLRDVSERKQEEELRSQHRTRLEQMSRNILTEEIAAALAHELNQPLSALIGYTATCRMLLENLPDVPPHIVEQMTRATAQAERAGSIVGRLRETFRSGHINPQPVAIRDIVGEVLALVAGQTKDVLIETSLPEGLSVDVDRLQVEQVLINLIRNSLDALAEGHDAEKKIQIFARVMNETSVLVSVFDNGTGITPETAATLFHPFTTTRASGMGLGLAISRSIIESHGGKMWNEANASKGAVFHFTLPLAGRAHA